MIPLLPAPLPISFERFGAAAAEREPGGDCADEPAMARQVAP